MCVCAEGRYNNHLEGISSFTVVWKVRQSLCPTKRPARVGVPRPLYPGRDAVPDGDGSAVFVSRQRDGVTLDERLRKKKPHTQWNLGERGGEEGGREGGKGTREGMANGALHWCSLSLVAGFLLSFGEESCR